MFSHFGILRQAQNDIPSCNYKYDCHIELVELLLRKA